MASQRSFVVMIGDVMGSRALPDRARAQRHFIETLAAVQARLEAAFYAPFRLSAGDAFQAILTEPAAVVDIALAIAEALHPVALVWGVGYGSIATDWAPDPNMMDGPCYHRARSALRRAVSDGAWLRAEGFSEVDDLVISSLFRLMGLVRASWTETQRRYMELVAGRTQREAAEELKVDESAISHALRRAHVRELQEAEDAARAVLRRYSAGPGASEAVGGAA